MGSTSARPSEGWTSCRSTRQEPGSSEIDSKWVFFCGHASGGRARGTVSW